MKNYIDKLTQTDDELRLRIDNMLTGNSRTKEGFIELANALVYIDYNPYAVFPDQIAGNMWSSSGMYSLLSEINHGLKTCEICFVEHTKGMPPMIIFKHYSDTEEIRRMVLNKCKWLNSPPHNTNISIYTDIKRFINKLQ